MKRKTKRKSKRKSSKKRVMKRKIVGFTKTKGKFALVFKKGNKLSVGKSRYSSKAALTKRAQKLLKK